MRHAGRLLHRLLQVALALVVLAAAGLAGLSWRLSQGPLELPWLVPRLAAAVEGSGYRLTVGGAALAWEGLGERVDRPVDIQLRDVTLLDSNGGRILRAPSLDVSLSFLALLRGQLRPRAIDIDGLQLRAWRRADGSAALDLASQAAPAGAGEGAGAALLAEVLAEMARPVDRLGLGASVLSALRRVRLREAAIRLVDRQFDVVWHMPRAALDLRRRPGGGMDGTAAVDLDLGGQVLKFTATATLPPAEAGAPRTALPRISFHAALPPMVPAALARAVPSLAPLAALDALLTLDLSGDIDTTLAAPRVQLTAEIGPGTVHVGAGVMPLRGATLVGEGSLAEFDLRILRLDVSPALDRPRTRVTGWLHVRRAGGQVDAAVSLALDHVDFTDLPALWPVGVGGPGTRPWISENITAGQVSNLHVGLALRAPEDFSTATVTYIEGGAVGRDVTVHWLRPVPPVEHAEARLSVLSPDALRIDVLSGRQAGGALAVTGAQVVLSGLSGDHQFADIDGEIAGPVSDLLAVLSHPRIQLLSRRPIPMRDPSGQVAGRISVMALPLKDDLSLDELRIHAQGRLTDLHLGGVAAGHDLDHGMLDLDAGNDGLTIQGTGVLGGIASQLRVEMDFRDGGPAQVIQTVAVSGTADAAQLEQLGLAVPDVLTGAVGVQATLTDRRDGAETLAVAGDLAAAELDLGRLHWTKPAGQSARVEARVLLRQGRITAVEGLRAQGSGLDLQGRLDFAGGKPRRLQLQRLALGPPGGASVTDASGEVAWPAQPGAPWVATLAGPSLDAAGAFGRAARQSAPDDGKVGPAWKVDARFARVLFGDGGVLTGVAAQGESDGRVLRQGRVTGSTLPVAGVPGGPFSLTITPGAGGTASGGRVLAGTAADAGGLLRALVGLPDMVGGRMTLSGTYDDTRADHPLSGVAHITDYRLHDAPVVAKLLQALSVYGIVAALEGRDMAFAELVAPFRLTGDTLELMQARTYNSSLGLTAKGRLDTARQTADVTGTVVPAYFLNSLLGRLPLIGPLLSPERGGGLFALSYWVNGPFADPSVGVNPLSAVTPGFLRGLFGIFDAAPARPPAASPAPAKPPTTDPSATKPPAAKPPAASPPAAKPPPAWGSGTNG
ncbi:MAG: hypothetical protein BGP12_02280 [Rhodospirillales bacterium 70-18]|nr:MAG: hypothetical protein BGP12_02280 [Rhodospirillales bacterium 70-18]